MSPGSRSLLEYIRAAIPSDGFRQGREYVPLVVLRVTREEQEEILRAMEKGLAPELTSNDE